MSKIVIDIEGNGLREDITKVWCVVAKDIDSQEIYRFRPEDLGSDSFYEIFDKATTIIGHNIIGYDCPVLHKFYKLDFWDIKLVDTFVWSVTLYPDRQLPEGCPAVVPNPITGHNDRIGPHSLEAHGWRLGYKKIHHHDWHEFSEHMLERCESDVLITEQLYYDFLKETGQK